MSANLSQRLISEMRRSPKKAALLALLAGVALWYWAPLVTGLLNKKSKEKSQAASPQGLQVTSAISIPQQPTAGLAVPPTAATAVPRQAPWQHVLGWIEQDQRMRPAAALAVARNPFQPVLPPEPPVEAPPVIDEADRERELQAAAAAAALPPEKVQLPLTGIIVGPARRTALIGGRPYQAGDTLYQGDVAYVLLQIERDRIVVRREIDQQLFEQAFQRRIGSSQLEIRRQQP